jgi:hypothetical protein
VSEWVVDYALRVIAGAMLFIGGCSFGARTMNDVVREEAAKAGAAEWVTGEDGEPEFRWRTQE